MIIFPGFIGIVAHQFSSQVPQEPVQPMLRYDAGALATVTTVNADVSNWVSLGTVTASATQAGGGSRPTHGGTGLTAYVEFSSSLHELGILTSEWNSLSDWHMYAVITPDTVGTNNSSAWLSNTVFADSNAYRGILLNTVGGTPHAIGYDYNSSGPITVSSSISLGAKVLIDVRKRSNLLGVGVNGGAYTTVSDATPTAQSPTSLKIGKSYTAYDGKVHEIYVYNNSQTDAQRTVTCNWLKYKWGL